MVVLNTTGISQERPRVVGSPSASGAAVIEQKKPNRVINTDQPSLNPALPGAQKFFLPGSNDQVTQAEYNSFIARTGQRNVGREQDFTPLVEQQLQKAGVLKLTPEEQLAQIEQSQVPQETQVSAPEQVSGQVEQGQVGQAPREFGITDIFTRDLSEVTGERVLEGTLPIGGGLLGGAKIGASAISASTKAGVLSKTIQAVRSSKYLSKSKAIFSGLAALGAGAFGLFGLSKAAEFVGFAPFKDKAPFVQQSFNTLGETATSIANDAVMTPEQKLDQLAFIKGEMLIMGETLQKGTIENLRLRGTKEMLDMQTDYFEKLNEIIDAENAAKFQKLQNQYPTFDETVLSEWVTSSSSDERRQVREAYQREVRNILGVEA